MTLKMTWYGSSTFMLEDKAGNVVFVDPWLDGDIGNPGCPLKVVDVARADMVLVTHGDPAHYGRGDSVRIASKTGCRFGSSPELCEFVTKKGLLPPDQVLPISLNKRHKLGFIEVTMFPVIHPPHQLPPGEIPSEPNTGFALTMGDVSILHTGDTILGDNVYRSVAAINPAQVAFLPITSKSAGHGTLQESVEVAASIAAMSGVKYILPHYRYVPNNPAVELLSEAVAPKSIKVVRLEPGESFTLNS
jgi:L-ascorbate metabolism protein UlaG (beta-lactamase superfamily)